MKNKALPLLLIFTLLFSLTVTSASAASSASSEETSITLSNSGILVNGSTASTDASSAVYTGANIIYYESGKDSTYGDGTSADAHTAADAADNSVVTITKPGTYRVSGTLSKGQLAIDLGSDAKKDPSAVVNLILDNVNITCTVAPAVIFYNVYESGSSDEATATWAVDTSKAGANVILADGSKNYVDGSYVAKIYKAGSTKKLHKYDGAFYSKMSMNISGESAGTGELHIKAANEGLDTELHLTINSGNIWIEAQNDGINTNEDNVSVTTINGGYLYVNGGLGAEGDGIDSNGYLVINGGTVVAMANPRTGDGGIDADKGIYLNGGTVMATGSRNDAVNSASKQPYMELSYAKTQAANSIVRIEDSKGNEVVTFNPLKQYQSFTYSSPALALDTTYHVYAGGAVSGAAATDGLYVQGGAYTGGTQQQYTGNQSGMMGGPGGGQPPQGERPELPAGQAPEPPSGERPALPNGEAPTMPEGMTPPADFDPSQQGGAFPGRPGNQNTTNAAATEGSVDFQLTSKLYSFSGVSDSVKNSDKTAVTVSISGLPYTDVQKNSKYYDAVKFVSDAGYMNGVNTNTFATNTTVNRAMAITILGRVANAEAAEGKGYSDVVSGSYYAPYVGWATNNSIVSGYGNGQFGPNDAVTRQQMAVILYNYATAFHIELPATKTTFKDASSIATWASDAVNACQAAGLLDGVVTGDTFNPTAKLTRGELADMMMRFAALK